MAEHIKIGDISPRASGKGNGVQTRFDYLFPIFQDADLEVYVNGTLQTLTTDYTVSREANVAGGYVEFVTPPGDQLPVVLVRRLAIERTSDFQESGAFRSKVINDELDYLTAALQQVADDQSRSVRLMTSDSSANFELPDKEARAGRIMSFDSIGGVALSSTDSLSMATLQAFMEWKVDTFAGDGTMKAFELAAEPGQIGNTQVFWDGVYQSKKDNYTVSGTTLTFTTAPPIGVRVEVVHGTASSTFVPEDASIADAKIIGVGWPKITGTPTTIAGYGITDFSANVAGAGAAMLASNGAFTTTLSTTGNFYGTNQVNVTGASNPYFSSDNTTYGGAGSTMFQDAVGVFNIGQLGVGESFKIAPTASVVDQVYLHGAAVGGSVGIGAHGTDTNIAISHGTKGAGVHNFYSDWLSTNSLQFQVNTITSAAVNYVEVYGNSTGAPAVVSVAGSDPNISHYVDHKGAAGTYFRGAGAAIQFAVNSNGGAINYGQELGGAIGYGRQLRAAGSDANVAIDYSTQGAHSHYFYSHTRGALQFLVAPTASTVSYLQVAGGGAGSGPYLRMQSSEANAWGLMYSKGAGGFQFYGQGDTTQFRISPTASAVNYLQVAGAATAGSVSIITDGADADIDLDISAKGWNGLTKVHNSVNGLLWSIGAQYGGSVVQYIRDSTPPTTNPGGGGLLYSEAGALKWRGPAGTVTELAPA